MNSNLKSNLLLILLWVCSISPVYSQWIERPNGYFFYDSSGNPESTPRFKLFFDATGKLNSNTSFGDNGPQLLRHTFDYGSYLAPNNYNGFIQGNVSSKEILKDGKLHSVIVGQINDFWGGGGNMGNMYQMFYLAPKVSIPQQAPTSNFYYLDYPSSFSPTNTSLLPQFINQYPDFYLPNKVNAYSYGLTANQQTFDLRKRGFAFWQLNDVGKQTFSNDLLGFRLDTDGWAIYYGLHGNPNTGYLAFNDPNFTKQAVENAASYFVGGGERVLVRDDEWRSGILQNEIGKKNEYYFFKKARELRPQTSFFCHQAAPYVVNGALFSGGVSESNFTQIARPLFSSLSNDTFMSDYVNTNPSGVYWQNVAGLPAGENAGKYMDISISGYISQYNHAIKIYTMAQELMVNKKYYPNSKVVTVLQGIDEVSVSQQSGLVLSWNWPGHGVQEGSNNPIHNGAYLESTAILSNFLGDGISMWGSGMVWQDTDPSSYADVNNAGAHTNPGTPNYAKQYRGSIDYLVGGMYKYSQIPESVSSTDPFMYEINVGGSWIKGNAIAPFALGLQKLPMAIGKLNSSGTSAVVAVYPYNDPNQDYTFQIRKNESSPVYSVTVRGQYPEVVMINSSSSYINLSSNNWNANSASSNQTVNVSSNTSWSISKSSSWITLNTTSGSGNGSFTISVSENNTGVERSGSITVSGGGSSQVYTIKQSPATSTGSCPVDEVDIGTSGSDIVCIKHFDTYYVICQKVISNGVTQYLPRGKNYWNEGPNFVRYSNADQYYSCINTSETNWWGFVNPLPSSYVPAGWTQGTTADGTVYFVKNSGTYSLSVSGVSGVNNVSSGSTSGTFSVTSTNVNWAISGAPSWASLSTTSGSNGNTTITVNFQANNTSNARSATLTISGANVTNQTVAISQSAGSNTYNCISCGGAFDNAFCDAVSGWVWDSGNPGARLTVDIYDGSTLVASGIASNYRSDLQAVGIGDGAYGFIISLPASLKDNQNHTLVAKVGSYLLPNNNKVINCQAPNYSLMVSGTTNGTISLPSSSSSTSFTVASTNVNWSITGMPSWVSLSATSGGNGNTVVNVNVLANNTSSARSATLIISGANATNQTVTISQSSGSNTYNCISCNGHFDYAGCDTFAGWVWDSGNSGTRLTVNFYEGGTLIASTVASNYRTDLQSAGIGDGAYGFSVTVPSSLKNSTNRTIVAKVGNYELNNNYKVINCVSPSSRVAVKSDYLEAESDKKITVYPNPTEGLFSVEFTQFIIGESTLSIVDMQGNKIKEEQMSTRLGLNKVDIDLSHQPSGTYIISLQTGNSVRRSKLIKQ